MSYSRFLEIMHRAGHELDTTELAEALWLARLIRPKAGTRRAGQSDDSPEADDGAARQPVAESATEAGRQTGEKARTKSVYGKGDEAEEGIPAAELLLPAASPLSNPAAAAIGRSLRPLARRRASRRDRQFDEEATAQASGETGLLLPVFRPASERWFSVAVVMEESAAMAVWQELAEELERLFARHGGFNQATRWRLRFDGDHDWLVAPNGSLQPPAHFDRLGERQLIVLLTDGASARWRDGRMASALQRWGRVSPVVILQVVPNPLPASCAKG